MYLSHQRAAKSLVLVYTVKRVSKVIEEKPTKKRFSSLDPNINQVVLGGRSSRRRL